jgi:uncharacterized protein YbjT (DUF2867 family)
VLFQPIAVDDVAANVARVAVGAPVNGIVDIAGPDAFRFDELIREDLAFRRDPRTVVTDPDAKYFGTTVKERSLVPGAGARLGERHFREWRMQTQAQQSVASGR